jgi:polysaccharide biosynthesis protein PslF
MSRIAFVAGTYLPASCSVSDYTARLHACLRDRGMESVVLTTHYAVEAAYDPHALGVVHGWRWTDLKALVKAVWNSGADALHIQYHPRIYGYRAAILLLPLLLRLSGWRSPIIVTVHEYGSWEWQSQVLPAQFSAWLKRWGQRYQWWDRESGFLLTLSDAVITNIPEAKSLIQARLPNMDRRLHAATEPIDCPEKQTQQGETSQVCIESFNWQNITQQHLEIYQSLVMGNE